MNALTICQPYAHLVIVTREKIIENRTWPTSFRGRFAVHAGKSKAWLDDGDLRRYPGMQFGAIIGYATLVDCIPVEKLREPWASNVEHAQGPWCWCLGDIVTLGHPIAARGAQGWWKWEPSGDREEGRA